ncbi:uncharacterized protein LOC119789828 isoform X4 [Cyprinodon tularosa]|uniref:uncharacterized protein LOC119789828 isoform X4 n=1 Tax=Cyprinodon tularosa TaxID=77115 RepID=UPI0018E2126D|nr:uncharacterized protein LOC119789828 isoform X4 [Cyprinodon tularosa]
MDRSVRKLGLHRLKETLANAELKDPLTYRMAKKGVARFDNFGLKTKESRKHLKQYEEDKMQDLQRELKEYDEECAWKMQDLQDELKVYDEECAWKMQDLQDELKKYDEECTWRMQDLQDELKVYDEECAWKMQDLQDELKVYDEECAWKMQDLQDELKKYDEECTWKMQDLQNDLKISGFNNQSKGSAAAYPRRGKSKTKMGSRKVPTLPQDQCKKGKNNQESPCSAKHKGNPTGLQ